MPLSGHTPRLIVALDDEPDLLELLKVNLTQAGFKFEGFDEPESFYRFVDKHVPSLVLLDLMLPGIDGLDVCRHLRGHEKLARVPVIMLTAKTDESDKVVGLELGADDYVTKPFSVKELVARVHAVLRRRAAPEETPREIEVGPLTIDTQRHEVRLEGRAVELTATEFRILEFLASRKGRLLTRDQILDHLWGHEKIVVDRTIDVHIRNLREKLGPAASLIKNVRGFGYKVEA